MLIFVDVDTWCTREINILTEQALLLQFLLDNKSRQAPMFSKVAIRMLLPVLVVGVANADVTDSAYWDLYEPEFTSLLSMLYRKYELYVGNILSRASDYGTWTYRSTEYTVLL